MSAALAGLLLAGLGAVELQAPPELTLSEATSVRIGLRSRDGQPHAVRLMGSCAGGARLAPEAPVRVPAAGGTAVERLVFRGEAPWNSRHELRLVAVDAAGEQLALGAASLQLVVGDEPQRLPALRGLAVFLGLTLLGAACLREALGRSRSD